MTSTLLDQICIVGGVVILLQTFYRFCYKFGDYDIIRTKIYGYNSSVGVSLRKNTTVHVYNYQMPVVTVDTVIIVQKDNIEYVLLIRRGPNTYPVEYALTLALPGGFMDSTDENAVEAARRETYEETGVMCEPRELFTVSTLNRDPRNKRTVTIVHGVRITHDALEKCIPLDILEVAGTALIPVSQILTSKVYLAFDHLSIIKRAVPMLI